MREQESKEERLHGPNRLRVPAPEVVAVLDASPKGNEVLPERAMDPPELTDEMLEGGRWKVGGKVVDEETGKAAMREALSSNPPDILAVLDDLHAPIRVPGIGEYQYACGRAALEIRKLRQRRAADETAATHWHCAEHSMIGAAACPVCREAADKSKLVP